MNYVDITPQEAQELLSKAQEGVIEEYEIFAQTVHDDALKEAKIVLEQDQKKQEEPQV